MLGITSGLNSRGGLLTSELNAAYFTFVAVVVSILVGDYFVRFDADDVLVGPYSFPQAVAAARYRSKEEREGKAEIVTFLGARGGDPITNPPRLFVKFMYIHGKRTLGGRMAEFNSKARWPIIIESP